MNTKDLEDKLNPEDFNEETETEEIETDDNVEEETEEESGGEEVVDENVKTQEDETKKHERNALQKQKRLEREAKERERRETEIRNKSRVEAQLEILKENPYTFEPIVDEEDLNIYKIQKQLEDEGKDPVTDLPKRLAEINRKRIADEKAIAEKEDAEKQKLDNDIKEFVNKYPNVNTKKLADNKDFMKLHDDYPELSTTKCYELYSKLYPDKTEELDKAYTKKVIDMTKTPNPNTQKSNNTNERDEYTSYEEYQEKYWGKKYGT